MRHSKFYLDVFILFSVKIGFEKTLYCYIFRLRIIYFMYLSNNKKSIKKSCKY